MKKTITQNPTRSVFRWLVCTVFLVGLTVTNANATRCLSGITNTTSTPLSAVQSCTASSFTFTITRTGTSTPNQSYTLNLYMNSTASFTGATQIGTVSSNVGTTSQTLTYTFPTSGTFYVGAQITSTTQTGCGVNTYGSTFTTVNVSATSSPTYAALPYVQGFEGAWGNSACYTADAADSHWKNTIGGTSPSNNDIWHRSDYSGADWSSPTYGNTNWPTQGSQGSSLCARFHNYYAPSASTGSYDLYVDCSGAGTKTLNFDYLNTDASANSLTVLVSTDGGATFPTTLMTLSNGVMAWTAETGTIVSTSATTVIRFRALSNYNSYDMGIDNVNLFLPAGCSGTPLPGNTLSTANPACSGVTFTLSTATSFTGILGITYQWQSSPDGSTWTNVGGGTTATLATSQTSATYYQCLVTCSGNTGTSTPVQITMNNFMNCYCTPNSSSGTSSGSYGVINNVTFNTLNNSSTYPSVSPYYTNYAPSGSTTTSVLAGSIYNLSVYNYYYTTIGVWIDFNQNGIFDASEYTFVGTNTTYGYTTYTVPITIPANAVAGATKMRVRGDYATYTFTSADACTLRTYGESEDYTITIVIPPPCSGTPTPGNTVSTATSVCSGVNFTLSLQTATAGSGVTFQWQSSADGTTWANVAGATSSTLTTNASSNTYYHCLVTCSGNTGTSNSLLINVAGCINMTNGNSTTCSANFYSSAGNGVAYSNSENYTYTFYPNSGNLIRAAFSAFSTESGWDGLVIYNGPTTGSPIISSGLGVGSSATNCPAGSFYGTTSPGTVTSSDASGALTFQFRSDGSGTSTGWAAVISCIANPACSGTPAPGNTLSTLNPVCPSTSFTLSYANVVVATGQSYQWQSSPDGSTWSNVAGATSNTLVTTQSVNTYYQCLVTCSGSTGTSTPLLITTNSWFNCYCTNTNTTNTSYYTSAFSTTGGVTNITNNASGFSTGGYGNFLGMSASQVQGSSVSFSSTIVGTSSGFAIWIDWNQNGSFADAGEQVYNSASYVYGATGSFTVPGGATPGATRMRIVSNGGNSSPAACTGGTLSECEDYTFNVIQLVACSGTPAPGNTLSTSNPVCSGVNFTLSLQTPTTGTGITYQWQSSANGTIWTNVGGATSSTLVTNTASATYYHCLVTCSGNTGTSNSLLVNVAGCINMTNGSTTTCSANFYSSAGNGVAYANSENYTYTFYPNAGNFASATFSAFSTESGWDGLVIYNGPTTASPIISSGLAVGSSATNCPAGSFYGTTSPGTVTSTDVTGALTFQFRSDGSGTSTGWAAVISCIAMPVCTGTPAPGNTIASSASTCAGNTVNLSLQNATSGLGVTYQWYNGAGLIGGATTATYTTPALFLDDTYYCAVTCSGNTGNSAPVTVTVIASPVGGTATGPATAVTGATLTYNVTGTTGNLQWQVSTDNITFTDIVGSTSTTANLTANGAATYYIRCKAFGAGCTTVYSNVITTVVSIANDNVCNAIALSVGDNGTFTNIGATGQTSEVTPPGTGCTTQDGWCSTGYTVNSVWFTFTPATSGKYAFGLSHTLFDSEMALYSASSCSSFGGFTLMAANDDSLSSPYNSYISQVCLQGGTTYYLLVDGYSGTTASGWGIRVENKGNTAPVISNCPLSIVTGNTSGQCGANVNWTAPTVNDADNCGTLTFTPDHAPGSLFPLGNTTVIYTAYDGANTVTCSFTVTVNDTEVPTITAPSAVTVCNGDAITLGTPTTGDNCGVATVSNNAPGVFPVGLTVVTWTVTDVHGNTATATQNVTVNALPDATISATNGFHIDCNHPQEVLSPANSSYGCVWTVGGTFWGTFAFGIAAPLSGTWGLTVTDGNGCTASSTAVITENFVAPDATISATNGLTFCDGNNTTLSVPVTGTTSQVWNQNGVFFATVSNPLVTVAATYDVIVTDGANGCTASSSATTVVNQLPIGSASNIVICNGDPSNVPLNSTEAFSTFTWTSAITFGGVIGNNDCSGGCGASIADVLTNTGNVHGIVEYTVIPTSGQGCVGAPFTVDVTVGAAPAAPVISGPNALCGLTSTFYTVAAVPEATSYVWTVPTGVTGMTILGGQGTTSLHVSISAGTVSGDVTCTAINNCGSSVTTTYAVTKKPAIPGAIAGPTSTCGQNTATYSVSPVFGATSYIWTLPAGMTVSGASNLNTITVNIAGTFVYGQLKVSAVNACGNIPGTGIWITGNAPTIPLTLSGPANVCGLTTGTYSIPAVAGASGYNWTITGAGNSISGSNTGTTVTAILAGPGTISVAATNLCGPGLYRALNLVTTAVQPGAISGPLNTCGLTTASYSVAPVTNAATYNWSLAYGMTWVNGQGTNVINVNIAPGLTANTATSPLKLTETNTCGNTSLFRTTTITRCLSPDALNADRVNTFSAIYPNPTSAEFTMDVTVDRDQAIVLEVFDILGNVVISEKHNLAGGTSTMKTNMEPFNNGMYFVRILDANSNVMHTERVVKQ